MIEANLSHFLSDPKIIKHKANEYGITLRAVTDEMIRIVTDLKNMYAIMDKQGEAE